MLSGNLEQVTASTGVTTASRNCAAQADVRAAFAYAFSHIKPQDAVVVGMYTRHLDQVALNVEHTLRAIEAAAARQA